jgi:hypothetical protein
MDLKLDELINLLQALREQRGSAGRYRIYFYNRTADQDLEAEEIDFDGQDILFTLIDY